MEQVCEAIITFEGPSVQVEFAGVWTKRMVDIAHKTMINKLPAHLATLRVPQTSERKTKKENSK